VMHELIDHSLMFVNLLFFSALTWMTCQETLLCQLYFSPRTLCLEQRETAVPPCFDSCQRD
jgi:hypothetical protein